MASREAAVPNWARNIKQLRRELGLSQTEFGSRLNYSAMAISRWESGAQEPTARAYIQLGSLCDKRERLWFWSRAGLKRSDSQWILREKLKSSKELVERREPKLRKARAALDLLTEKINDAECEAANVVLARDILRDIATAFSELIHVRTEVEA
jgi:transcriptional regulator with XRE-family HTH domain